MTGRLESDGYRLGATDVENQVLRAADEIFDRLVAEKRSEIRCPECGGAIVSGGHFETTTLVGFSSPPGHNHNRNCRNRTYQCENGHEFALSIMQKCPACDWTGKEDCFCHPGRKVLIWPIATLRQSSVRSIE